MVVDLAREFATATNPDRLIERLCGAARSVVGARSAVAGMAEPGQGPLLSFLRRRGPIWEPASAASCPALADLLRAGRTVRKRLHETSSYEFGLDVAWAKITSALAVPIAVPGRTIGVLCLLNKLGADEFTEDEARVAETLASQAAVAHENIRLMRETERRLEFVTALRAIDVAITGSLEIRLALDVVLDQVLTHLGVDAASILLYNRGSNLLETTATRGNRSDAARERAVKIGVGLAGSAAHERRVMGFAETPSHEDDALIAGERWAAYYAAPLVSTQEWTNFFEAFAGQAAIAIDEAELFSTRSTCATRRPSDTRSA